MTCRFTAISLVHSPTCFSLEKLNYAKQALNTTCVVLYIFGVERKYGRLLGYDAVHFDI
jgi:hypothetical protein